jgi:hypothetical protein
MVAMSTLYVAEACPMGGSVDQRYLRCDNTIRLVNPSTTRPIRRRRRPSAVIGQHESFDKMRLYSYRRSLRRLHNQIVPSGDIAVGSFRRIIKALRIPQGGGNVRSAVDQKGT